MMNSLSPLSAVHAAIRRPRRIVTPVTALIKGEGYEHAMQQEKRSAQVFPRQVNLFA